MINIQEEIIKIVKQGPISPRDLITTMRDRFPDLKTSPLLSIETLIVKNGLLTDS